MKSFEKRLERLEEISESMQSGETSLDEAVSLFEEGIKLSGGLEKELKSIERKIEILMNKPEKKEEPQKWELFDSEELQ